MLEWILDRDGHEFLVDIDRAYLKDKSNLIGIKEQLLEELNIKDGDTQFKYYIRHLYKAAAPTKEDLADEKYLYYVQDIVDLYGLIHQRYIRTEEGK